MSENPFQRARREQAKLRLALIGPSGSGKTYTALAVAEGLALGKVAVIDTEHGSASKYAGKWEFDVLELPSFEPERYMKAIRDAEDAGYGVLVIDSLSHAWAGRGGLLEFVDKQKDANPREGFAAWGKATPKQNALIESILNARCHVIATMRSKMDYVQTTEGGRTVIKKVGMQPVQRDGVEYEFDIVGDLDDRNSLTITKTRCEAVVPGEVVDKPGAEFAQTLKTWLMTGEVPAERPKAPPPPEKPANGGQHREPDQMTGFWSKAKGFGFSNNEVMEMTPGKAPKDMTDQERAALLDRLAIVATKEQERRA